MAKFIKNCSEDKVHVAVLGVKGVEEHVVLAYEVNIIHMGDLYFVLNSIKKVNIVCASNIGFLISEVLFGKILTVVSFSVDFFLVLVLSNIICGDQMETC